MPHRSDQREDLHIEAVGLELGGRVHRAGPSNAVDLPESNQLAVALGGHGGGPLRFPATTKRGKGGCGHRGSRAGGRATHVFALSAGTAGRRLVFCHISALAWRVPTSALSVVALIASIPARLAEIVHVASSSFELPGGV